MKDRKRKPDSRKNIVFNIQSIILSVLMAISLVTIIVMGLLLYHRFKLALEKTAVRKTIGYHRFNKNCCFTIDSSWLWKKQR